MMVMMMVKVLEMLIGGSAINKIAYYYQWVLIVLVMMPMSNRIPFSQIPLDK